MSTAELPRAEVFLFLMLGLITTVISQDSPLKICLKDEDRNRTLNVTLVCPLGTVVSVGEAFFGRNQWGLCLYTDNDCTKDINSFHSCNGQAGCTRLFNGTYTRECGYSTFLTVIYDCVAGVVQTPPPQPKTTPHPSQDNSGWTPYTSGPRHVVRVASWDPVVTPKSRDDTALIAGCAVAVVITVTVLIIAIILVIRRLFGIQGNTNGPKKPGISVLICTKLGCAMAICRDSDPEGGDWGQSEPQAEEEDEGRVTPLGADAVEVVHELGRSDVTSGENGASTSGTNVHHSHPRIRETSLSDVRSVQGQESAGTSTTQGLTTAETRMDAVALPNTELSTLC